MGRTATTNIANNGTTPPPHRRRAGTALDDFAHRKGVTKAIQDYRHRQTKKRTETAKALRHYKKTMKQEGYEAGKGASRKRNDTDGSGGDATPTNKKKNKTNPFAKSLKKQRSNQTKAQEAQREANEKERTKKIKERRRRSKQLRQRTSKGQPVMKHVIGDILRKLQREQEQEKQGKEEEN